MTANDFKKLQKNEVQGEKIAEMTKNQKEKETLLAMSKDEWKRARTFGKYSGVNVNQVVSISSFLHY